MPRRRSVSGSFMDLRLDRSGTEARPLCRLGTMMNMMDTLELAPAKQAHWSRLVGPRTHWGV